MSARLSDQPVSGATVARLDPPALTVVPPASASRTSREDWLIFSSVVLAAWCYTAATTIGNAVLPQMQGDLSVSLDQISWVVTASIVAGALGIPPTPWLAARLGVKTLLVGSLVSFTVASAMIGLSESLGGVVLWRIVQASFGAPILVLSQTIVMDVFPLSRRGPAMAIWSAAGTTGWVMGPTLGAYLGEWYGWQWSFAVLAPIAIVSLIACAVFLPSNRERKKSRLDWMGFVTLSMFLLCAQIVLNRGQRQDWFESAEVLVWAFLAAAGLFMYCSHTLTSHERLIRWSILLDKNFTAGIAISAVYSFLSLGPLVLVPSMLQELKGLELTTVGLSVVPRGIAQMVVMLMLGPFVTRMDARIPIAIGLLSFALGNWMLANYNLDIGLWQVYLPQLFHGVGSALVWLPIFNLLYATLPAELRTDAATAVGLVYSLGGSASVAVLVALLSVGTQINAEELGSLLVSKLETIRLPEYREFDVTSEASLLSLQANITEQASMLAYVNLFWLLTGLALLTLPLLVLISTKEPASARA